MAHEPEVIIASLNEAPPDTYVIMYGSRDRRDIERAVGPFTGDECRDELRRLGVPPAAIEARLMRAQRNPAVG
jgi:hypothetical protein